MSAAAGTATAAESFKETALRNLKIFHFALLPVLLLLLLLSACTVRSAEAPGEEIKEAGVGKGKPVDLPGIGGNGKGKNEVPASGSDLFREPASEAAKTSLQGLYDAMEAENAACGIAFLGYADPNASISVNIEGYGMLEDSDTAAQYPFLYEMTAADCADICFSELYCIVPSANADGILVEQTAMDEEAEPTEEAEETLYQSDSCGPVFVCADSNGWDGSNVLVTIRLRDGSELRFHPFLYCNLGTVGVPDGVYDFTVYSNANPFYYGPTD